MRILPYLIRETAYWQRIFQTLLNVDVHTGVPLKHTLIIFSTINAKVLIMQHEKFQIYIYDQVFVYSNIAIKLHVVR